MQFFPNSMEMFVDKTKYHYYYYLRLNSGDLIWIQFSFQFQKFFIHYGSLSRTRLVGYATIAILNLLKHSWSVQVFTAKIILTKNKEII